MTTDRVTIQDAASDMRDATGVHEGDGTIRISRFFRGRLRMPVHLQLWELAPGITEGAHTHRSDDPDDDWEEVYYVLSGRGRLILPDGPVDLEPGQAALVPTDLDHGLASLGTEPLRILLLFGKPGAG
jgi:oxalate decarboxylase/phosphoglucose isomerase-like protein (cupin superfamily)